MIILATAAMMVFGLWGTLSLTQVRDVIVKYGVAGDDEDDDDDDDDDVVPDTGTRCFCQVCCCW